MPPTFEPLRFGKLSIYPFRREDESPGVILSVYKKRGAKGLDPAEARRVDPDAPKITARALLVGEHEDVLALSSTRRLTRQRLLSTLKAMIERGDIRELPVQTPAGGGLMRRFLPTGQNGRELYEANKAAMLALLDDPRVQIRIQRIRENGRDVERVHIIHLPGDPV